MFIKKEKIEYSILGLVMSIFLGLGIIYIFINPLWAPPDELAHFSYSKYIVEHKALPIYEHHLSIWEAHQPPLYYLVGAPLIRIFQYKNFAIQVYSLRFLSLFFGLLTVFISYLIAKKIFPDNKYIKLGVPAIVAFLPMFSYISSSINNDNLANLLGSLILLLIIIILEKQPTKKIILLGSFAVAASFLTKTTLIPMVVVYFIILIYQTRKKIKDLVIYFIIPQILLVEWWFVRNLVIYGDPLGWSKINELWTFQYKNIFLAENFRAWWKMLYNSFFGIFGKLNITLSHNVYLFFAFLICISFLGLLILFFSKRNTITFFQKKVIIIFLICFILTLGGVFYNSTKFYQPQGRYLFPVITVFSLFIILGASQIFKKNLRFIFIVLIFLVILGINIVAVKTVNTYYKKNVPNNFIRVNLIEAGENKWYNQGQLDELIFSDNILNTKSLGNDPRMASPNDLKIESNIIKNIIIELKVEKGDNAQLFWRSITDMNFFEKKSFRFRLQADNNWHTYVYPMDKYFDKPTLINQFRFDPTNKISDISIRKFKVE